MLVGVCVLGVAISWNQLLEERWARFSDTRSYVRQLEQLASFGEYLDRTLDETSVLAAPRGLRDYIPGLSAKSKSVVYYRRTLRLPYVVNRREISRILSPEPALAMERRVAIMKLMTFGTSS
jgi:hypothetical protein